MALMAASGRLAAAVAGATPSTPSGMVPVYQKPAADERRRKAPGAKPGHHAVALSGFFHYGLGVSIAPRPGTCSAATCGWP